GIDVETGRGLRGQKLDRDELVAEFVDAVDLPEGGSEMQTRISRELVGPSRGEAFAALGRAERRGFGLAGRTNDFCRRMQLPARAHKTGPAENFDHARGRRDT